MNRFSHHAALLFPVVGTLLAFCLPWLTSSTGAALTFNALDLAEWGSLHPGAYTGPLMLLPSGLVRASLVLMAAWTGLVASSQQKPFAACIIVLLAVVVSPPAEFVRFTDNANYRQLALMAVLSLMLGMGGLLLRESELKRLLTIAALLGTTATGLVGYFSLSQLMDGLNVTFSPGIGVWLLPLFAGAGILIEMRRRQNQKRSSITAAPY